jgi:hypothetical protein
MLFFVQVSLASDFMYNHLSKDVTASVGYDYNLRQVRHMQFGLDIFVSMYSISCTIILEKVQQQVWF